MGGDSRKGEARDWREFGVTERSISRRRALAFGGATLLAYVGLVHEVVGSTLYPHGPAAFGGLFGWHAAGLSVTAIGLLIAAGTLGLVQVPIGPLAVPLSVVGFIVLVGEALQHRSFHFFAFTIAVAGIFVAVQTRKE